MCYNMYKGWPTLSQADEETRVSRKYYNKYKKNAIIRVFRIENLRGPVR